MIFTALINITRVPQVAKGGAGRGDGVVLTATAAADPDDADDRSVTLQWDTAGENRDPPVVGYVDPAAYHMLVGATDIR